GAVVLAAPRAHAALAGGSLAVGAVPAPRAGHGRGDPRRHRGRAVHARALAGAGRRGGRGRRGVRRVPRGDALRRLAGPRGPDAPRAGGVTRLAGMRVLVTGAGGFVGPHLLHELARRGANVRGAGLGAPPAGTPLVGWLEVDLADLGATRRAIAAAPLDAIVHLAGQSSAARSFDAPEETFRANVTGT